MENNTWEQRRQEALERKRQRQEGGLDLVDGILDAMQAAQEQQAYPHRSEIPEALVEYADWFVEATRLEPDRRVMSDWIAEFSYWSSKGLTVADLRGAYSETKFMVTRPGSLTSTAVALKAKKRASHYAPDIFRANEQPEKKYVPMPDNIRARLDAKLKQDKVGQSNHEPKHIGDIMKGLQS